MLQLPSNAAAAQIPPRFSATRNIGPMPADHLGSSRSDPTSSPRACGERRAYNRRRATAAWNDTGACINLMIRIQFRRAVRHLCRYDVLHGGFVVKNLGTGDLVDMKDIALTMSKFAYAAATGLLLITGGAAKAMLAFQNSTLGADAFNTEGRWRRPRPGVPQLTSRRVGLCTRLGDLSAASIRAWRRAHP